jgi:hypothetical protein
MVLLETPFDGFFMHLREPTSLLLGWMGEPVTFNRESALNTFVYLAG